MRLSILLCAITFTGASTAIMAEETGTAATIYVHVTGQAKTPGTYGVPQYVTVEALMKACGGATELGSVKNITVIRFARTEGVMGGENKNQVNAFIPIEKLKDGEGRYHLQAGDILYIPGKVIDGR